MSAVRYDYLIFDADHTVIDFDLDEKRAFRAAFRAAGVSCSEDMIEDCWRFSAKNWADLGLTEVDSPVLRARFHALYHEHVRGIVDYMDDRYSLGSGKTAAARTFSDELSRAAHPVDGALEVLDALAQHYKLCIATNGLSGMQAGRLSALRPRFARIFVSEEMGCVKPDAAFFHLLLEELKTSPDKCLMIGDSLRSDIAGANAVGMDCVWFDRRGEGLPEGVHVRAVIHDLRELLSML